MSTRAETVGIVGAGPFGVALASVVARAGRRVILLSRDPAVVEEIRVARRCARLPEAPLPPPLIATTDLRELARESHLVVLAVASTDVRERARELGAMLDGSHLVVHAVGALARAPRGADRAADDERVSEVVAQGVPTLRLGVLAGPALPSDLAHGALASMVVASAFDDVIRETRRLLAAPPVLRVYGSHDVIGVELASAISGVYTIALGLCDGLRLGPGPRAVLITRAIAEAGRLGVAAGADVKTFSGLAGLGNLLVRAVPSAEGQAPASAGAPRGQGTEYQVGLALARGQLSDDAAECEGARAALAIERLARRLRVRMPLIETMAGALSGRIRPEDAARLAGETVAAEE